MISLPSAVRIFLSAREMSTSERALTASAGSSTTVLGKTRYAAISSSFSIAAGTASSCSILTATGWPFGTNASKQEATKCLRPPRTALSSSRPSSPCCSQESTCGQRVNESDFRSPAESQKIVKVPRTRIEIT